jgi:DNA-binding transcriptional MerR regulator
MSEQLYDTKHVAALHSIAEHTVREWSKRFKDYLSDRANPGQRRQRVFNRNDMEVFDLIAAKKNEGLTFEDIEKLLKSGERGGYPESLPVELDELIADDSARLLMAENSGLRRRIEALNQEISRLRDVEKDVIRFETQTELLRGQLEAAQKEGQEKNTRINELEREIGRLEAQIEMLKKSD